jgi:hypothetical protein
MQVRMARPPTNNTTIGQNPDLEANLPFVLAVEEPSGMGKLHLPTALEASPRVLVAGAGGGFDVYVGLLIYERLRSMGKPENS